MTQYVKLVRSKGHEYRYFNPPSYLERFFKERIRLPDEPIAAQRAAQKLLEPWLAIDAEEEATEYRSRIQKQIAARRLKGAVAECVNAAGKRAAAANYNFEIDADFVIGLAEAQDWSCAISGIKFKLNSRVGRDASREPFRPSIDRIHSKKGYTKDNCRLVCVAVNVALGAWGDEVFLRVVRYTAARLARNKMVAMLENSMANRADAVFMPAPGNH